MQANKQALVTQAECISAILLATSFLGSSSIAAENPYHLSLGKVVVPLGEMAGPSDEAEAALLPLLERSWRQREAALEKQRELGEEYDRLWHTQSETDLRKQRLRENVSDLLTFCEEYKNTDAALTAVLALARLAKNSDVQEERTSMLAVLGQVKQRFPTRWQSYVIPLIKGPLRAKPTSSIDERREFLRRYEAEMPPRGFELDLENPQVQMVLKLFSLRPNLRAECLARIGHGWKGRAYTSALSKEMSCGVLFEEARRAYERVIAEYPTSYQADRARSALQEAKSFPFAEYFPEYLEATAGAAGGVGDSPGSSTSVSPSSDTPVLTDEPPEASTADRGSKWTYAGIGLAASLTIGAAGAWLLLRSRSGD